jgi:outer membrane protein
MIKKISLILLVSVLVNHNGFAITLSEALKQAYINNPVLNAERENIQISKEDLNISRGEFLPTVTLSGSKSQENTKKLTDRNGANSAITDVDPQSQSIVIEQKIFQGLAGLAGIEKSKIGLNLAEAKLLKTEQDILYKAVEAYSGLIFADKKLNINQNNINLLERQVETDQARLERNQITLVDLAQSESSLAGAQANFIQARNEVVTAKLVYEKIIGPINNSSILDEKLDLNFEVPIDLDKAIEISKVNNPNLIISKLEYEQSEKDVTIARSELSPTATLSFNKSKTEDTSSTINERDKELLKATISWPIFNGGKNTASLSRSKNLMNRNRLLLDNALKTNETDVASAWSSLQSSRSLLNSVKSQVKAAEIANEGITVEYESGLGRSTLDVIQSNSILLSSKISLADSQRNYLLSRFRLLQSLGLLNSNYLELQ